MDDVKINRRARNRQRMRRRILDAARGLIAGRGPTAAGMEQVAEAADVARGTLYNHFPSKAALLAGLLEQRLREAAPELDDILAANLSARDRLGSTLATALAALARAAREMDIDPAFGLAAPWPGLLEPALLRVIEAGQKQGELRADRPAPFLARSLAALAAAHRESWLASDADQGGRIAAVVDFFLRGAAS